MFEYTISKFYNDNCSKVLTHLMEQWDFTLKKLFRENDLFYVFGTLFQTLKMREKNIFFLFGLNLYIYIYICKFWIIVWAKTFTYKNIPQMEKQFYFGQSTFCNPPILVIINSYHNAYHLLWDLFHTYNISPLILGRK